MISPTIGRILWFQPAYEVGGQLQSQPYASIVTFVHDDRRVNLGVFTPAGTTFPAENVTLLQDDDVAPEDGRFAAWMPYQAKQAASAANSAT